MLLVLLLKCQSVFKILIVLKFRGREYLCSNACGSGASCVLQAVPHLRDLSSQRFEREPTGLSTLGTFEAVSVNVPNMMFRAGFEGRVENWRGRGDGDKCDRLDPIYWISASSGVG